MIGNKLLPRSSAPKRLRNYAFVDSRCVDEFGQGVQWQLMRERLREQYGVKKAYVFLEYEAAKAEWYGVLQSAGYDLVFRKRNINVELVLQIMIDYRNYDGAIVVSGEQDIAAGITYLVEHEKLEQLIIPDKKSYAALLLSEPLPQNKITLIHDVTPQLTKNDSALKIQV